MLYTCAFCHYSYDLVCWYFCVNLSAYYMMKSIINTGNQSPVTVAGNTIALSFFYLSHHTSVLRRRKGKFLEDSVSWGVLFGICMT